MKISGAATLSQPPSAVWSALNDPALLTRAIPGCERLDVTGPGECALTVRAGIAAVAGTYAGHASAVERTAPELIHATAACSGNRGQVVADVTVRLEPSDQAATEVSYEADIRVEGPVVAVGQRVLASVARRLASQFLAGIEAALAVPGAPVGPAAVPGDEARPADAQPATMTPGYLDEEVAGNLPLIGPGLRAVLAAVAAAGIAGLLAGFLLGRRARKGR